MMPDLLTRIIALFHSYPDIKKMGFLSSFFITTPESFTDANEADLDEIYEGEEIAPTVTDLSTGAVTLVETRFPNRQIPFPVYALRSPVTIQELMTRQPGENAHIRERINWFARLSAILVRRFGKMTRMLRRSMEYQASQVLQTGDIILTDEKGNETFRLNMDTKPSHFPTVTIPWSESDATPLDDIDALADVIRDDGLVDVTTVIMGKRAWINFIKNEWVQKNLDKSVLKLGELNPQIVNKGGKRMGFINYGSNTYTFYTYNARYNPFGDKDNKYKFIEDDNVILLPDVEDLDFRRLFGGIPTVDMRPEFTALFGGNKVQIGQEYDFRPRVWFSEDKETYIGEAKSRALMLPVSRDRYGCMKTA